MTVTIGGESDGVTVDDTDPNTPNDQKTLTFTTDNWDTTQTVKVRAADDDDAANESVTLSHTASGGGYGSVSGNVAVTVTDTDTAGLVFDPASVTVTEGESATYTVKLATEPSAAVTVTIGGESDGVTVDDTDGNTEGDQKTLTFTTDNWDTTQTVKVRAADDDDAANESVTLSHTASGGDYGTVTGSVSVTVTDTDTAGLVFDPASVTVTEGESATYTVKLATEPSAAVTVTIGGESDGVTVDDTDGNTEGDQKTLTFTTDNWDTTQTVTVRAADDDDAANESVTLSHTASGGDYGTVTGNVAVTVTDTDTAGLVFDPASVTVTEGESATYTVKLATQPSAAVTVTIGGESDGVTVDDTDGNTEGDQKTLTFTTDNWDTTQTVKVRAADDDDAANESVTLSHTASGGDYGTVTGSVSVTVTDTDTAGLVFDPASVTVTEGESATYTVKLATEPSAAVTVTIGGESDGVTVDDTDPNTPNDQKTLTFTTDNWDTTQTVTVRAADDDDTANESVTLSHTASGGDYGTVSGSVSVTVTDTDTAGLVFDPASVTVTEGESATYTVKLATQPSAAVTVTIGGESDGVTVDDTDPNTPNDQKTLTFTTDNWDTTQTVTVRAADDDDAANESVTLSHTASGGGYGSVSGNVAVTVTDDDTAGLVFDPASVTVTEGESATYTVKLATEPSAAVTVTIGGESDGVTVDDTDGNTEGDQKTLTFTTDNWDTTQTVTVRAADDDDTANESVTLSHTASGGDYGTVTGSVSVTVTDTDTAGLVFDPASVTVTEGESATYTVKLATQPSAAVTVTIGGESDGVTVDDTDPNTPNDQKTLTFTTDNWDTTQTVKVRAADDDDAANESVTLSHTASGGGYGTVSGNVAVTVTDDRHRGPGVRSRVGDGDGGRERDVHGEAGDGAERRGDGDDRRGVGRGDGGRHRRQYGRRPEDADLHDGQLGHHADGDGAGRR